MSISCKGRTRSFLLCLWVLPGLCWVFLCFQGPSLTPFLSCFSFPPAEDASGDHGEVVSTISSSMNPLQPPDASSEEPFTTYFDSKIPIPEDETVSAAEPSSPRSDRKIRSEKSASAWYPRESFPWVPVPLLAQSGEGSRTAGWRSGGEEGAGSPELAAELMIHHSGFVSQQDLLKSRDMSCSPRGRDLGSLFPYQGRGARVLRWPL